MPSAFRDQPVMATFHSDQTNTATMDTFCTQFATMNGYEWMNEWKKVYQR